MNPTTLNINTEAIPWAVAAVLILLIVLSVRSTWGEYYRSKARRNDRLGDLEILDKLTDSAIRLDGVIKENQDSQVRLKELSVQFREEADRAAASADHADKLRDALIDLEAQCRRKLKEHNVPDDSIPRPNIASTKNS